MTRASVLAGTKSAPTLETGLPTLHNIYSPKMNYYSFDGESVGVSGMS